MKRSSILITKASEDYELIDSGEGEKLERFGEFILSRPDPQALWPKRLPESEWQRADAYFTRESERADWTFRKKIPEKWGISFGGLKFFIKPTAFKHTGLFPEQAPNWEWLEKVISSRIVGRKEEIEILNLFGYTGGASLACAHAGAKVVHIDGSKAAVTWAHENADLSGLSDKPIRWIVEDARVFVEREIRRGRSYDGIIMDPPAFGHGPSNELWKIEDHFLKLVEDCEKLLKSDPLFFTINGYSAGYSAIAYENNLISLKEKHGGVIEIGELAIEESGLKTDDSRKSVGGLNGSSSADARGGGENEPQARLLPAGIFARWSGK